MIARLAGPIVIGHASSERKHPEVIVEGVVFLHYDDDVVDPAQATLPIVSSSRAGINGGTKDIHQTEQRQAREERTNRFPSHADTS